MNLSDLFSINCPTIVSQLTKKIPHAGSPIFFLFLRAFNDDKIDRGVWHVQNSASAGKEKLTTSEVIVRCLADMAPAVQLGHSRRYSIISLSTTKSRWKEDANHLMTISKAIFLQIGLGHSLSDEAKLILTNSTLSKKTFVVIDPDRYKDVSVVSAILSDAPWYIAPLFIAGTIVNPAPLMLSWAMGAKHREHGFDEWDEIRKRFDEFGMLLPNDLTEGVIYNIINQKNRISLNELSPGKLKGLMNKGGIFIDDN